MPSQRNIREKALLSLFSASTLDPASLEGNAHWEIILEPENKALVKSSVKTLKHLLQSFPKHYETFTIHAPIVATHLREYEEKELVTQLRALQKEMKFLAQEISQIGAETTGEKLHSLYSAAPPLRLRLTGIIQQLHHTQYPYEKKDQFLKGLENLKDHVLRIHYVASPTSYKDQRVIEHLLKETENRDQLREKAAEIVTGILTHLEMLDGKISPQLKNFSEKQIGKVERTLLRLGAYELLVLSLPKGVVINEALELTKKYATPDAVPLINGVLDHLER